MPLVVTIETDRVLREVRTETKGTIKGIKILRFTRQLQQSGCCNCLVHIEFPASVIKKAASGSRGSCSGTMHVSVTMSPEISSLSRMKDKDLLSLDDYSRFSCRFSLVHLILS
jgi:hypothetical protein